MYILLYVGAAIFVLTALSMVVDAFKRKVFSRLSGQERIMILVMLTLRRRIILMS